jgi:hypothetical protein
MLVNVTKSRLVIGRFSVIPGEKVPALPMTAAEAADVRRLTEMGFLVEQPNVHKSEAAPQKPAEPRKPAEPEKAEDSAKAPAEEPRTKGGKKSE